MTKPDKTKYPKWLLLVFAVSLIGVISSMFAFMALILLDIKAIWAAIATTICLCGLSFSLYCAEKCNPAPPEDE